MGEAMHDTIGKSLRAHSPWDLADEIAERVRRPSIPKQDFPIVDFGAVGDGIHDSTAAIRAAIDAASKAGGGRVVAPPGVWLTGAVHLRSHVELHITKDAVLRFSTAPQAYLPIVLTRHEGLELMNYSPFIYAYGQTDIAITGGGVLDGGAGPNAWWSWAPRFAPGPVEDRRLLGELAEAGRPVSDRRFGPGRAIRPKFVQPYRCQNVLIEGLTIIASPMWVVHPVECENVLVRGLKIISHGPNNDGCNPESCRDVLIEDCVFDTGDDCIAIKSGRDADGRRLSKPTENVVIRDCQMLSGHGGVTLGSEITGGVSNVFVERCHMVGPYLQSALRFKNNAMRGGVLRNIHVRDIGVEVVSQSVIVVDYNYQEGAQGPHTPVFETFVAERIHCRQGPRALDLQGFSHAPLKDIEIRDCRFDGISRGSIVRHAPGLKLTNSSVNGAPLILEASA